VDWCLWTSVASGTWLLQLLLHPFNGLFSRTTWVSRHQKCKTSLDLIETRDDGVLWWQWHQLDHKQTIYTSLQTDNHTSTSSFNFYGPDALPDAQPTVSCSLSVWVEVKRDALCYSAACRRCIRFGWCQWFGIVKWSQQDLLRWLFPHTTVPQVGIFHCCYSLHWYAVANCYVMCYRTTN